MEAISVYLIPGLKRSDLTPACLLRHIGATEEELKAKSRRRDIVEKRQIYAYVMRKRTKLTCVKIGEQINRDHASIVYSVNAVKNRMFWDREFEQYINRLLEQL